MNRKQLVAIISARADELREQDPDLSPEEAEGAARRELVDRMAAKIRERHSCKSCGYFGPLAAMGLCGTCYRRDLRRRQRIKVKTCEQCHQPFQTTRKDAILCSATCRSRKRLTGIGAKNAALAQEAAKIRENGHADTALGCANPPKPYSKMTPAELRAFSFEQVQALKRRELAQQNDARNAAIPTLHIPARTVDMIMRQRQQMFVDALREASARRFQGLRHALRNGR